MSHREILHLADPPEYYVRCKKLVAAKKQFTINKAPQVLHIHLKRFTPTGRKIVGHISYPEQLSLGPYMSEESEDVSKESILPASPAASDV